MLEQKLTNTDGLNPLFGEQLLWFDGQSYHLTPTSSPEAYDIRALKKHWYVYLTGDVAEDTKEIERKSFLKGLSLDECLCDLGIIDDDDIIHEDEIKVYALVDDDGNIVESMGMTEHQLINKTDVIAVYDYASDNQTKADAIISGALIEGFPMEAAMVWVMQLGYMAQDRIVEEMNAIADTVQSWMV